MELSTYFKAVMEADRCPIVICNLDHEVIYVNKAAAERYSYRGNLVGTSILDCHPAVANEWILKIVDWFKQSPENNVVYEGPGTKEDKDVYSIALRDDEGNLIGYYEKHEWRTHETGPKYAFAQ